MRQRKVKNQILEVCNFALHEFEQAQHAFLSLTADTYGKISDDFVCFLWMMATAASTNFRLSQPSPNSEPSLSQDTFTKLRGSLFSRFRLQIAAAIAKAAAARSHLQSLNIAYTILFLSLNFS